MAETEEITISGEGVTLSLLVWRRFRDLRPGFAERVLDLNPGLAGLGIFIPVGTTVLFPVDPVGVQDDEDAVALWD